MYPSYPFIVKNVVDTISSDDIPATFTLSSSPVYSSVSLYDKKPINIYSSSLPIIPVVSVPTVSVPLRPDLDLNRDYNLHRMMIKYFYYKTLDKWLKKSSDLMYILGYLKIDNGIVKLLDNINDYNPNSVDKDNQDDIEKKVDYIENNILSKDDVEHILKKYVNETSTNWFDLQDKSTYFIKELIGKFIKNKLVKLIKK